MEPRPSREHSPPRYRPLVLPAALFALGIATRELLGGPAAVAWSLWVASVSGCALALARGRHSLSLPLALLACFLTGWGRLDLDLRTKPCNDLTRSIPPGRRVFVRLR